MSLNPRFSVLAGAIALALGNAAMANTNLDGTTTGNLFVNVVDTTDGASFLYDTGVSQASFNASTPYQFTFTNDANYKSFVAAEGANDVIDYSILSATKTTASTPVGTIYFTTNLTPAAVPGSLVSQAQANTVGFFTQANLVTSATTNSAYLSAVSGQTWGQASYETAVSTNLKIPFTQAGTGDSALAGTPLNFYSESSNALSNARTLATLTQFSGQWDLVNGVLSFAAGTTGGGPGGGGDGGTVPLPAPVLLLLSGIGLLSVVARRGKTASPAQQHI